MSETTFYVNANGGIRLVPVKAVKGEVIKRSFDWNAYLGFRGTTISSSSWSAEDDTVSVASATNSGGVTGISITATYEGATTVKNTVVLANGETLIRKFRVVVTDPLEGAGLNDYA